jgi:hypothetical protein
LHLDFHTRANVIDKSQFIWNLGLVQRGAQGVVMTTEGHIAALERRHQELDRQIEAEQQNTRFDHLTVSALKRKKLEVKDELTRFSSGMQ